MTMHANRAFDPDGYDTWWRQGRQAAEEGLPRSLPLIGPFWFIWGYESTCWFDGYDNHLVTGTGEGLQNA